MECRMAWPGIWQESTQPQQARLDAQALAGVSILVQPGPAVGLGNLSPRYPLGPTHRNAETLANRPLNIHGIQAILHRLAQHAPKVAGGITLEARSEEHTSELQSRPHLV